MFASVSNKYKAPSPFLVLTGATPTAQCTPLNVSTAHIAVMALGNFRVANIVFLSSFRMKVPFCNPTAYCPDEEDNTDTFESKSSTVTFLFHLTSTSLEATGVTKE